MRFGFISLKLTGVTVANRHILYTHTHIQVNTGPHVYGVNKGNTLAGWS